MDMPMDTNERELSLELLQHMYRTMLRIRRFEECAGALVEKGQVMCPCHLYIGQEAIATGVCAALRRDDFIWGGHRSHGHYLAKGGSMRTMMAELFGKSGGCSAGRGGSMHLAAPEVGILGTVPLVAATIPLAVGSALAFKLRKIDGVAVAFFGDGAVEEGHFHESLNLASLYRLPVVFVCENNFYSSHLGLLERRSEDNIYKTSEAHGIRGLRIDGNDVIAVYHAATDAVQKARTCGEPMLLECRTYRWRGHVGPSWDMDVGVKRKDELEAWLRKDPIAGLATALIARNISTTKLSEFEENVQTEVQDAVAFAQRSPYPEPDELEQHVFSRESEVVCDR